MTKDRISEMLRMMREAEIAVEDRESVPEETSQSITSFLEQVECCRNEIRCMRDQIDVLNGYHRQIQRCTNDNTRKDLEDKVEEKKTLITSSILAIRNNIKSIQEIFSKQRISPALKRMKEVQINSLTRTLNEVTEEYYNCLVDHSEKCKKILYDMISLTNEDKADLEELIQKGKIAFFTNNLLLNELEQKVNFRDIEDRQKDIMKIEKSILELKNLTQDLSLVVAVQGEKVHAVDEYVQKTAKKVDDAARIMKKASKKRNKARRRKVIISLLCSGLMVMVVVLVVVV